MLKNASVFLVSYDTWLAAGEVDGDVEEPPSADRPWKVSSHLAQAQKNPLVFLIRSSSPCIKGRSR